MELEYEGSCIRIFGSLRKSLGLRIERMFYNEKYIQPIDSSTAIIVLPLVTRPRSLYRLSSRYEYLYTEMVYVLTVPEILHVPLLAVYCTVWKKETPS